MSKPVIYLDLDNTLLWQCEDIETYANNVLETPVEGEVEGYTIWVRPGAVDALQRLRDAGREVHILTSGHPVHQMRVVKKAFPGFLETRQSVVYATSDRRPPSNKSWVLVDDLAVDTQGTQQKMDLLGKGNGTFIQVQGWYPLRSNAIAVRSFGREPNTLADAEDGSVLQGVVDKLLGETS